MEQYALIGYPLGHSLSPQIHQKLFALEGIKADYHLDSFPPETFEAHLPALRAYRAFNITIPYKRSILPFLDWQSDAARLYGSVNAVHNDGGRLYGDNTDCGGFLRTMESHAVALQTDVCVLGAGGVGRMFAIECARQGARVTVAVRESGQARAKELAAEAAEKLGAQITIADIATLDGRFGLVINATPAGMYPKVDDCPVSEAFLERTDAVFDCIYNPSETLLLRRARALGKRTVGGMDMLVWQAAIAHERWHGSHFTTAQMNVCIESMNQILLQKEQTP